MGNARTLKHLIEKGFLGTGDSFKIDGYEYLIREISDDDVVADNKTRDTHHNISFSLSDKVYPVSKNVPEVVSEKVELPKTTENKKEFTISFSCKTDFEYVDKESKTMEEALEKARNMTPWQMILKSEPVDVQDEEVNIFGLISNEP